MSRIARLTGTQSLEDDLRQGVIRIPQRQPPRVDPRVLSQRDVNARRAAQHDMDVKDFSRGFEVKQPGGSRQEAYLDEYDRQQRQQPRVRGFQRPGSLSQYASDMIVGINAASEAESVHMSRSQMLIERLMASGRFTHSDNLSLAEGEDDGTMGTAQQRQQQRVPLRLFAEAGDGNCLFRSLSRQLFGDPSKHLRVRHAAMLYISINRELYAPFLEEGMTIDSYIAEMSQSGSWGGETELSAVANLFQVKIHVYTLADRRMLQSNAGYDADPQLQIRIAPYQPLDTPMESARKQIQHKEAQRRIIAALALVALFRSIAEIRDDYWLQQLTESVNQARGTPGERLTPDDIESLGRRFETLKRNRRAGSHTPVAVPQLDRINRQLTAKKLEGEKFCTNRETRALANALALAYKSNATEVSVRAALNRVASTLIQDVMTRNIPLHESLYPNREHGQSHPQTTTSQPHCMAEDMEDVPPLSNVEYTSTQNAMTHSRLVEEAPEHWLADDVPESEFTQQSRSKFGYFSATFDPDAMVDDLRPIPEGKSSQDFLHSFIASTTASSSSGRRNTPVIASAASDGVDFCPRSRLSIDSPFLTYRALKRLHSMTDEDLFSLIGRDVIGLTASSHQSPDLQDISAPILFEAFTTITSAMRQSYKDRISEAQSSGYAEGLPPGPFGDGLPPIADLNRAFIFAEVRRLAWLLHVRSHELLLRAISLAPGIALGSAPIRLSYLLRGHYDSLLMADRPMPPQAVPRNNENIYYVEQATRSGHTLPPIPYKRNTTVPLPSGIVELILFREIAYRRILGESKESDQVSLLRSLEESISQICRNDRAIMDRPDEAAVLYLRGQIEDSITRVVERAAAAALRVDAETAALASSSRNPFASETMNDDDEMALALQASMVAEDNQIAAIEAESAIESNVAIISQAEEMMRQLEQAKAESLREQELAEARVLEEALMLSKREAEVSGSASAGEGKEAKSSGSATAAVGASTDNGDLDPYIMEALLEEDIELQQALALSASMAAETPSKPSNSTSNKPSTTATTTTIAATPGASSGAPSSDSSQRGGQQRSSQDMDSEIPWWAQMEASPLEDDPELQAAIQASLRNT